MMKIENDKVVNHRGDVLAEKVYGSWESKDPEVLIFIQEQEKPKAAPSTPKKSVKKTSVEKEK